MIWYICSFVQEGIMQLHVINFNIRFHDDPNCNTVVERALRLHNVISRYAPDILCLQEYRVRWKPFIERYFGSEYEMFNQYRDSSEDSESVPILWRRDKFTCLKTGAFWLSDTPETESPGWDTWGCYRNCLFAVLKENESGKTFTVMNTHFGFGDDCQVKSANVISDYSKKISAYPTFITGDFNMTPDSAGYSAMTKYFTDVNAVTVNDLRTTYHGYHPEVINDQHIDYCFVNDGITPVMQKILDDLVDGKFPSDHYGILSILEI